MVSAPHLCRAHIRPGDRICAAVSGGADSVALLLLLHEANALPRNALGVGISAVHVHHGLRGEEADADLAFVEELCLQLAVPLHVHRVSVPDRLAQTRASGSPETTEEAARTLRYEVFARLIAKGHADSVLTAHTLDDQAETVLLGLGRGSGARSIAGMRPCDPPWYRPLLGVRRSVTHAACAELGITPWQDPHNADRRFTRSRLRAEVLPLLEDVLGGGVAEALARTGTALREDTAALDELAQRALADVGAGEGLDTARLAALPDAIRRRVIRGWLLAGGADNLTDKQIRGVDSLVTAWRGQGGVAVGSPLRNRRLIAGRRDGKLALHTEPV